MKIKRGIKRTKICTLLREGKRPAQIKHELGVSGGFVSMCRKELGLPKFKPGRTLDIGLRLRALEMKRSGMSYRKIGLVLGTSFQTAHHWVRASLPEIEKALSCCRCGQTSKILHHHHLNYDSGEGETLCASCHALEHLRRGDSLGIRRTVTKPLKLSRFEKRIHWCKKHACCVICGSSRSRHHSNGKCVRCYKSEWHKNKTRQK